MTFSSWYVWLKKQVVPVVLRTYFRSTYLKSCKLFVSYGQCCALPVGLGIKIRGSTNRQATTASYPTVVY